MEPKYILKFKNEEENASQYKLMWLVILIKQKERKPDARYEDKHVVVWMLIYISDNKHKYHYRSSIDTSVFTLKELPCINIIVSVYLSIYLSIMYHKIYHYLQQVQRVEAIGANFPLQICRGAPTWSSDFTNTIFFYNINKNNVIYTGRFQTVNWCWSWNRRPCIYFGL